MKALCSINGHYFNNHRILKIGNYLSLKSARRIYGYKKQSYNKIITMLIFI